MESLNKAELKAKTLELAHRDAIERAITLSSVFAVLFALYGVTSIGFIHKFAPEVSLWSNLWPRLLFCSLPFVILAHFLKKSRLSDRTKLFVWITAMSVILNVTSWIEIWPITLKKSPEILTYVNAANVYLFAVIFSVVAPPKRCLAACAAIFIGLFVVPLLFIAYKAGDRVIFNMILNDSALSLGFSIFLSMAIDRLRSQIAYLKFEKEQHASQFLGPIVARAIFEGQEQSLELKRCPGYIISIDIRDSTGRQQRYGKSWLNFRREYFSMVSETISQHKGYVQKTIGDCHLVNFGVMDYGPDLSDIPGIGKELAVADEQHLQRASDLAFACLDELFELFYKISDKYFPEDPVFLGAGIDKGWVERGVQGSSYAMELDVNGDPVNCSSRLQEYSKFLMNTFASEASIIVVSPFAADYLRDTSTFMKVSVTEKPIRNYPGIKWVFVKKYGKKDKKSRSYKPAA